MKFKRVPEKPKLSFELRRQMNEITGNLELSDSDSEQLNLTDLRFDSDLLMGKNKIQQITNVDEYIAKMIQKEEEIKKNYEINKNLVKGIALLYKILFFNFIHIFYSR